MAARAARKVSKVSKVSKRRGAASGETRWVQPHRAYLVRGAFGHTVEIVERQTSGEEITLSLASVLDLSYSHALELLDFLGVFLAKQPQISLDNKQALNRQIMAQQDSIAACKKKISESEQRIKKLAACYDTAPGLDG